MGFFNSIKGLMRDDPAGRYLGFVIKELADQDATFLPALLGVKKGPKIRCETEYSFANSTRRADLAVYLNDAEEPEYLVEIKVNDNSDTAHNRGQFEDYENWAKEERHPKLPKRKVFIISPFGLKEAQNESIRRSKGRLRIITLSHFSDEQSLPAYRMFADYLNDSGYIMENFNINGSDASAFKHFLVSAFMRHQSGLGREAKTSKERVSEGPKVFASIVSNFQLFVQSSPWVSRKPTVKYLFEQRFEASRVVRSGNKPTEYVVKVNKSEESERDKEIIVPKERKTGGKLYLFAYCPVDTPPKTYLEIGIEIFITLGEKNSDQTTVTFWPYMGLYKGGESIIPIEVLEAKVEKNGFPAILFSQAAAHRMFSKFAKKFIARLKKCDLELASKMQDRLPPSWK